MPGRFWRTRVGRRVGCAWLNRCPAGSERSIAAPVPATAARRAWRRCLPAAVALARTGSVLLLAGMLLHGQIHQALESRLAPSLEGRDLEVTLR